jgi:hypothetical protein
MANKKITVEVDVQANTAKEIGPAERLGAALKSAADSAQKIKVPAGGTTGGATGVGAVMQKSQPVGAQAVMQYGQQRGTAGVTGAEARDFARQSEGLGGLVRLYATYAANIYAVGAAFRALSTAMDTTNMVRGLDQLGAQGGVALGSLSKQLVATTGGAISLREAMSATVKVTAAGLGSENVLRLGQVATKASQALGVDMGDAINRLSRGITKLEPELLDELGIFTKIEPAVEKYAISVGKSATQLTDFERRQAFANAVLAEGEKKFAAIKLDANPYNKLAASLTNIAQQGLELLNKVLGPIVDILSSNPTALVAGLATIGTTLIKQAVPAFGLLRQNIQKANEEANAIAASKARDSIKLQENLNKKSLELIEERANKEIQALDAAETKFKELKEKGVASKKVAKVLQTESVTDISTKQITTIENEAIKARNKGLTDQAKIYDDLAISIRNGKKAEEDYLRVQTDAEKQLQKDINNRRTIIGLNKALADSAEKTSFKNQIVSNAAFSGSMIGPINAIKLMLVEIKASEIGLGRFSLAMLVARGSLAAFAGAAATIGAVLNIAFAAITAIVGIGALLVSLFTDTAKESKATSEAVDQLAESTKNLSNTIDVINKKPYLEQFTAESLSARTNALETFSAAIRKANEASSKELQTMNWLDKGVDVVKMIWGGDVQSKLNKEVSYGLAKVFSDAQTSNSAAGKAAKQTIGKLLDIKDTDLLDIDTVNSALNKLSSTEAAYVISQVNAEVENLAKVSRKSSDPLLGLEESFKKVAEARQKFMSESLAKDSFTEFGRGLITSSFEIESALKNPEARLQAIRRTFEEIKNIGGIPQDLLLGLQDASQTAEKIQVLNASLNNTSSEIDKLTSRKDNLEKTLAGSTRLNYSSATKAREELETITQQIDNLQKSKEIDLKVLVKLDTDLQAYNNTIKEAQIKVFETGSQVVANRLSVEFAKAGATISKAIAGVLPDTEEGIAIRAKSDVALINAQIAQIKAIDAQITAQLENTLALKERALADKMLQSKLLASTEPDTAAVLGLDISKLSGEVKALQLALKPGGSFKQLSEQRIKETRTLGESAVSENLLKTAESRQGNQARVQQLTAEVFAILEGAKTSTQDAQLKAVAKRLQDEEKSIALDKQRLTSSKELTSDLSEQGVLLRQSIEARESALKTQADLLEIDLKIKKAERFPKDFPKAKAQFEAEKKRLQANQEEEAFNKRLLDAKELITVRSKVQAKAESDKFISETNSYNLQTQLLDNKQKVLEFQKQQGLLLERDYILQKSSLDTLQLTLNYNKEISVAKKDQKLALIEQKAAEDRLQKDIEARRKQDSAAGKTPEEFTQSELESRKLIADEVDRINNSYATSTALTQSTYQNTISQLEAQKQLSLQQEEFNNKLSITKGIGESLASVFGKFGTAIGEAGVALRELNNTQKTNIASVNLYGKKLTEINDTIDESQRKGENVDPKLFQDRAAAQEDYGRAIKKAQTDEISGNLKVLGSVKKMFKEKSAGYKAISAIEKVMHITKLAMDAAEMASNMSKTVQIVINAGINAASYIAEAGAAGIKAITNSYAAPFPLGFIAGSAMAVIIGGLLGKAFKGGKGPSTFMPTKEQRQETQGTAMGFDKEGNKVQVRAGVLGAPDQKTESISKSLDILAKNSEFSLDYSDKLLRSFERLSSSIERAVAGIAGVKGLTRGNIGDIEEGTRRGFAGWKKTTTTINDSGIKLSGTLDEIVNAGRGVVGGFADVTTETSKWWGLSKNINRDIEDVGLDNRTEQLIRGTITQVYNTGLELGKKGGMSEAETRSRIGKVDTTQLISLRDLSGEDLQKAYSTAMSQIYDDIAVSLYGPIIESYGKLLEAPGDAATRILDSNEKINVALRQSDPSLKLRTLGFDVTEAITDSFGGLDNFLSSIGEWNNTFLTDQEKDANRRDKVGRLLQKYNITDLKDKDAYIKIVRTMIQNNEMNTDKFREFMEAGKDIDTIFSSLTDTVKESTDKLQTAYDKLAGARDTLKDIVKTMKDFKESLLTGDKSVLTPGEKYLQTKSTFETTRALALTGDTEAIKNLPNASNAFLDASRTMFASSDQYTQDFNTVTAAVDSITEFSQGMLTEAQQQLDIAKGSYSELEKINFNTQLSSEALKTMVTELQAAKAARDAAPSSSIAATTATVAPVLASTSQPTATPYVDITSNYKAGGTTGSDNLLKAQNDIATWFTGSNWYMTTETAATGSNFIPKDMPLYVHQGERIMPAADNKELMKMVNEYSGGGNGELYQEVCRLTKQVEQLTKVVADGAIMNAQATDRNTDELAKSFQETAEAAAYSAKLQNRTGIV